MDPQGKLRPLGWPDQISNKSQKGGRPEASHGESVGQTTSLGVLRKVTGPCQGRAPMGAEAAVERESPEELRRDRVSHSWFTGIHNVRKGRHLLILREDGDEDRDIHERVALGTHATIQVFSQASLLHCATTFSCLFARPPGSGRQALPTHLAPPHPLPASYPVGPRTR